ncbi:MAG: response regulator [Gammaproteobacteria bacterium]
MPDKIYRVLLVEDDQVLRQRMGRIIDEHPQLELSEASGDVASALAWLEHHRPDVLLVDLGLPDGHGTGIIRYAKEKDPSIESMVISVFADEHNVVSAIKAGATGYLLKDSDRDHIAESILDLIHGNSPISAAIARHVLKQFADRGPSTSQDPSIDPSSVPQLTPREDEVLQCIARGFKYNEVADMLDMSVHTVRSHIKHIYKKLEVGSRSEAVYEAVKLGIVTL